MNLFCSEHPFYNNQWDSRVLYPINLQIEGSPAPSWTMLKAHSPIHIFLKKYLWCPDTLAPMIMPILGMLHTPKTQTYLNWANGQTWLCPFWACYTHQRPRHILIGQMGRHWKTKCSNTFVLPHIGPLADLTSSPDLTRTLLYSSWQSGSRLIDCLQW